jgi:dTDP-L-rhamnose 4-epimerase
MKILVTGGAGFIGSHLADRLIQCGYEVRIMDNLEPQVHRLNIPTYLNPKAEFLLGDICNKDQLRQALNEVDFVFHLAAATGVGQSMYQISKYFEVNVQGTANLLDILANNPHKVKKIVLSSSRAIYGEGAYLCNHCGIVFPETRSIDQLKKKAWEVLCPQCSRIVHPIPTFEKKVASPGSFYGVTKLTQEMMISGFGRAYGIPTVIMRLFNVYGPRQSINNPYTGIITTFLNCLFNGNPPQIYEDGKMTRDFIQVNDVVNACIMALENERANQKTFNIGTSKPISIYELGNLICDHLAPKIRPQIVEKARVGDIAHCTADISLAHELLGFEPSTSLSDGLGELINYELANQRAHGTLTSQAEEELRAAGLLISK